MAKSFSSLFLMIDFLKCIILCLLKQNIKNIILPVLDGTGPSLH